MSIKKTTVTVEIELEVEFDPDKFTEDFQKDFKQSFWPYDTIKEHLEHLVGNHVSGVDTRVWDKDLEKFRTFAEGYGYLDEMNISLGEPEIIDFMFDDEDYLYDNLLIEGE